MSANTRKVRGKPFALGNAGRPRGARNRATIAVESLLDGEATQLTRRAIDLALAGDTTALRLCLERISPPRRDRPLSCNLPQIKQPADLPQAVSQVIAAVSEGDLTPSEGETIVNLLDKWRVAMEITNLAARVEALEATNGEP